MSLPFAEIENKLGYTFKNKALLEEAFTHKTYSNSFGGKHNDRLEYLGDAVLELVVTEWQYDKDERATSGKMTSQRQKLVCQPALDSAIDAISKRQSVIPTLQRTNAADFSAALRSVQQRTYAKERALFLQQVLTYSFSTPHTVTPRTSSTASERLRQHTRIASSSQVISQLLKLHATSSKQALTLSR